MRPARAARCIVAQATLPIFGREVGIEQLGLSAAQVLKRLFEMELHCIDQLPARALDHHLVAAQVRGGKEFELFRHAIQLQSVILPDAKDARLFRIVLPCAGLWIVNAAEDRIDRIRDANEAILVFKGATLALLMLLHVAQSHNARSEAQADEFMPATDAEHGPARPAYEGSEVVDDSLVIKIKILKRAAQDNRLRAKLLDRFCYLREVRFVYVRVLDETRDVVADIFEGEFSDQALAIEMHPDIRAPLFQRHFGEVSLVAQEIIYDEHAHLIDAFFYRLVAAGSALIERERERLGFIERYLFVEEYLLYHKLKLLCGAATAARSNVHPAVLYSG